MSYIINALKFKLGIYNKLDWSEIRRIEDWMQLRYRNEIHTDAGFEQMLINLEVKTKVPIHMSKLHSDWLSREDYISRKKEFQEM